MSAYAELDAAVERYHRASTLLEREQARVEVDLLAARRSAVETVAAAARSGDQWVLDRLRTLVAEIEGKDGKQYP